MTRIALSARLDCGGTTPLRLPPLELRDGTGVTFRRVVTGSSRQFLTECALGNLDAPPTGLRLVDVRTSGDQLVLSLATFGQRPLRLLTVASGGLLLAATPAPVMLFPTLERQVGLDPAPSCSADWAGSGPSGQLDLTLDWGPDPANPATESDPFRVEVQTGALGAEWLMGHSCSEWVR